MEPEVVENDADINAGTNVFDEGQSVFNREPAGDSQNPQETRGQEQQPENLPGTPPEEPVRHLMFVRNGIGQMKCAWVINGNQTEALRDPTPEELALAPQAKWKAIPQQVAQQNPAAPQAMGAVQMGGGSGQFQNGVGNGNTYGMGQFGRRNEFGQVVLPGQSTALVPGTEGGLTLGKVALIAAAGAALYFGGKKAWEWYEDQAAQDDIDDADDVDDEVEV